jgi:hypothetical protein
VGYRPAYHQSDYQEEGFLRIFPHAVGTLKLACIRELFWNK